MEALPIDDVLPELLRALRASGAVVLEAPPGAGKTTRVPTAVLDAGLAGDGEVVVLEPRRLAARLAARRVAQERGERLGETIGYQVRFDEVAGPKTRVRYVTEGVLTRRLLSDPTLKGVGVVVLDEFHERHLQGDVALALLQRLRATRRPDLRLVVMSATLEAAPVARFLDAPSVRSEGRRYDVAVEHAPRVDDRPLGLQVAAAVKKLVSEGLDGHALVFLPGAAEIRRARSACEPVAAAADLALVVLHGDLPPAEQDRAVAPSARRKVILSTNVAETSVTIEGVVAVVDSGLARVAGHAPWSGLPTLKVARVSRASATQRAGRAGRTRPGRCVRLYTRHDFDTRPEHDLPEVRREDLAETALELHAAGVRDLGAFGWFEAPSPAALDAADALLRALGALDAGGELTPAGRRMLRFPVHPRLGRMLVEAEDRGVAEDAALLAALLGERDIVATKRVQGLGDGARGGPVVERHATVGPSDLLAAAERFREARDADFDPDRLRWLGLDVGATQSVERVRRHLARACDHRRAKAPADPDEALLVSVLAGFPDRVARRVRGADLVLGNGGSATLAEGSEVRGAAFVVAVDAEERADARGRGVVVRVASAIEPEWLLELFPDAVREEVEARWNAAEERADVVQKLMYRGLVLDETRGQGVGAEAAARVLFDAADARGARAFAPEDALDRWLARVAFVAESVPAAKLAAPDEGTVREALRALCEGRRSFAELRQAGLLSALQARLSPEQSRLVERMAPERVGLPGGRQARVHYERGKRPWIESRLQDFFGMAVGPAVAGGSVPLVLHLLAPNGRAVQVTTDLAGFWERTYPGVRRELCRKYPRHPWPEDGRAATPPPPRRR